MTKYIFVTGGVVSGLGKGITAASLGRLLKARGLKVAAQKLDPYINVDPGTMSPYQHGEVYVTEDGAETDLDLGHYERFIDEDLNQYSNLTTGKVYWNVLNKERRGEYCEHRSQNGQQLETRQVGVLYEDAPRACRHLRRYRKRACRSRGGCSRSHKRRAGASYALPLC